MGLSAGEEVDRQIRARRRAIWRFKALSEVLFAVVVVCGMFTLGALFQGAYALAAGSFVIGTVVGLIVRQRAKVIPLSAVESGSDTIDIHL